MVTPINKKLKEAIKAEKARIEAYERKLFISVILQKTGLVFISEHLFYSPHRKWRFDFANLENKIAVEIEGGIWTKGRHTRPKGFIEDMEKYNTASVNGWTVIRIQPKDYTNAIKFIKMRLESFNNLVS